MDKLQYTKEDLQRNIYNFFKEEFDKYNAKKLSDLPIPEQRKIKEKFSKEIENETEHYKGKLNELEVLESEASKLKQESEILAAMNDSGRYGNMLFDAIGENNQMNIVVKLKIETVNKELDESSKCLSLLEDALKINKYSEFKRRKEDFKIKIKNTPQKICSLNIKLLNKIKDNGRKKYSNLVEKFNDKLESSNDLMEALEQEKNDTLDELKDSSAFERYSKSIEINKRQKKAYKKIKKYAKKSNALVRLKNGIVRSIDLPLNFYNNLNDKYEERKVKAA